MNFTTSAGEYVRTRAETFYVPQVAGYLLPPSKHKDLIKPLTLCLPAPGPIHNL
jgi:hypothetical protein